MNRLGLIYIRPFRMPPGSPLDFRVSSASSALASLESIRSDRGGGPGKSPDRDVFVRALGADPVRLFATQGEPIVVDGHRRMSSALTLDLEEIPAVLYPRSTSRRVIVRLSLAGKAAVLSGVEKIMALYKTAVFAQGDTGNIDIPFTRPLTLEFPDWILPLHSDLHGRKVSKSYLLRLCGVLAFATDDLRLIHDLSLTVEQITPLLDLTSEERRAALQLRRTSRFTTGEFKRLVRLLLFARGRKHFDLTAWVNGECRGAGERPTGSQIIGSLAREIHPELHAVMDRLDRTIRQMEFPNRLRIAPPENLEGESFSCYFKFSTLEELRDYVDRLERIIDNGSAEEMLRLLALEELEKDETR